MLTNAQKKELSQAIGASEIGAILGIDPYCTQYELWLKKTGRMEDTVKNEGAVLMGNLLEPVIARRYSQITGAKVIRVGRAYKNKAYPHMICHLDRKIVGTKKGVEIKTANPYSQEWGEAGTDIIPPRYIAQVQHQLACTGWEENDLIVFRGTTDIRIYNFKRDEEVIKALTEKVNHFWSHHIANDTPPEATTRGDLKLMFPQNNGELIEANEKILNILSAIKTIKKEIKELELEKEESEKEIIKFIENKDGIKSGENILVTFKADKNNRRILKIK